MVFFRFLSVPISPMSRLAFSFVLSFFWVHAVMAAPADSASKTAASTKSDGAKPDYILQPSDLIRIQIFQEDDLNREVRRRKTTSANFTAAISSQNRRSTCSFWNTPPGAYLWPVRSRRPGSCCSSRSRA